MTVPPWALDPEKVRPVFRQMRELKARCEQVLGAPLPHLSMGMTGDFEVAIEEGATMVRIGTALFGERPKAGSKRDTVRFLASLSPELRFRLLIVTTKLFSQEIAEAMKAYEKYIVCIDKTPEEFEASLTSLLNKAIKAYESRGPDLRHGIALDKQITVILSQNDGPRPLCGIYFNLHSPYQRQSLPKTVQPLTEPIGGGQPKSEG